MCAFSSGNIDMCVLERAPSHRLCVQLEQSVGVHLAE